MKKLIFIFTIILLLSGCSLVGTEETSKMAVNATFNAANDYHYFLKNNDYSLDDINNMAISKEDVSLSFTLKDSRWNEGSS